MTASESVFDFEEDDDVPKGYVGWANDVNKMIRWQLYQANVSENMIDGLYTSFMKGIKIHYLKLEAKGSLHHAFFSSSIAFSEYFSHDYFDPKATKSDLSLCHLLNFIPKNDIRSVFKEESECKIRVQHHDRLLHKFTYAYKSFLSASIGKQETGRDTEQRDTDMLIKLSLAFGPCTVSTLCEVGVGVGIEDRGKYLPHGYIDILVYGSNVENGTCVAMKLPSGLKDNLKLRKLTATSAKTSITFSNKGSERQSIVELLALSEVLKISAGDKQFFVIFKACQERFQAYLYFTAIDLLIKTDEIPLINSNGCPHVMGYFSFFLMVNLHVNTCFPELLNFSEAMKSGWMAAYQSCSYKYTSSLCPQVMPKQLHKRSSNELEFPSNVKYSKVTD